MTPASQRAIDEAALAARIEDMLTDLEACRLANLALPAGKVEQAAALIRLYAALSDTGADSWLALEHAKRAANLFKTERVLGSALPVPRPRAHLKTPTVTEILARQGPEPVQTVVFDLVREIERLLELAIAKTELRTPHSDEPL